jgi:alpha-1,2-mannosyltransferase
MPPVSDAAAVLAAMHTDPASARFGLDLVHDTGLTSGRLYPSLVRLERAGLVRSGWRGRGRRGYVLTPAGVSALDAGVPAVDAGVPAVDAGVPAVDAGVSVQAPPWRAGRSRAPARPAVRWRAAARRVVWWLPALVIALIESSAALSRPAGARLSDLGVYLGAVNGLRSGASLYAFVSANGAPFTYPPFAGLLLWPLSLAATFPLQVAWTLATVAIVVALSFLLVRTAARAHPSYVPAVAAVLLLSAPVSSNLKFGQVSVGLAALVVVDAVALRTSRFQGVLTGLAAAVKLTPLIFVPMLWLAGRVRAAVVAGSTFAACGALAWVALPADSWLFWSRHVWHPTRLGAITSVGNQSVNGTLLRLGVTGPARSLAVLAVAGAVAVVALRRAGRLGGAGDRLSAIVIAGAASIVVSPVSWTHHQLWLVIAPLLPVGGSVWTRWGWRVAILAVMTLPVTALGPPVWSEARMLAAIGVACLLPIQSPRERDIAARRRAIARRILRDLSAPGIPSIARGAACGAT